MNFLSVFVLFCLFFLLHSPPSNSFVSLMLHPCSAKISYTPHLAKDTKTLKPSNLQNAKTKKACTKHEGRCLNQNCKSVDFLNINKKSGRLELIPKNRGIKQERRHLRRMTGGTNGKKEERKEEKEVNQTQ